MACNVAMALHRFMGEHTVLQLEAFLSGVLLPLAEGTARAARTGLGAVPGENPEQELALEVLLDLCCQPGFVPEVYANLDCRVGRGNVLEDICALLSKNSFPLQGPLSQVNVLCADGLIAVLQSLAISCMPFQQGKEEATSPVAAAPAPAVPGNVLGPLPSYVDVFVPVCEGRLVHPALRPESQPEAQGVRMEKHVKDLLALAATHFNKDPTKGFEFLQSVNLLPDPLEPAAVAACLRVCSGLFQKSLVGEILGEPDDFSLRVLDAFARGFDFRGLRIDAALRMYLDAFRLPGEAQKIARILESFAESYYSQSPDVFRSRDAAYVLAYSVIMLNTDLHNARVKRKMTVDAFVSNNRGINEGADLPRDYLEQLYQAIQQQEIKLSNEGGAGLLSLAHWLHIRSQGAAPRAALLGSTEVFLGLSRDIYCLLWSPALAAFSVVLDHCEAEQDVRRALEGVLISAQMAAQFQVEEALDSAITCLAKYTSALVASPLGARGAERERMLGALVSDQKANLTVQCLFKIASLYGASLRGGWRAVVDLLARYGQQQRSSLCTRIPCIALVPKCRFFGWSARQVPCAGPAARGAAARPRRRSRGQGPPAAG